MGRELGIDTEKIRPGFAGEGIAERYFSATEQRDLAEVPKELRDTAFFLCWTRKEAYIKAHGDGLQIALDSFDVSLKPGEPETLRSADSEPMEYALFHASARICCCDCCRRGNSINTFLECGRPIAFNVATHIATE